ncbi:MAG: hypothetical protein ACI97A_000138 [Planctomycetota bacterium]|jgi:hypothetical protein
MNHHSKVMTAILLAQFFLSGIVCAQWESNSFGEKHALDLNPAVIAIEWQQGNEPSSLLDLGINSEEVQSYALKGWSLVNVPASAKSGDAFLKFVKRLAQHDIIQFATPVFRDSCDGYMFPTQDLLIRFDKSISVEEAKAIVNQQGTILDVNWGGLANAYRVKLKSNDGGNVLKIANSLATIEGVIFSEPDFCFTGEKLNVPNDPRLGEMWGVSQELQLGYSLSDIDMDLPEAWDISTGLASVKIAVLDEGVQMNHPDMPFGMDGVDTTTDVGAGQPINAFDNHGTSVAGVITSIQNNGIGVAGVVPDAQLLAVRCYLSTSNSSFITMSSWTVAALDWCEVNGVRVTNNSVVLGAQPAPTTSKYDSTAANGMLHFAAAGNDPTLGTRYPANLSSVNGLIGINFDGTLAFFSATGSDMAYSAPASQILTTDRSGSDGFLDPDDYVYQAGTSFATAFASASATYALSINPSLTASEVHDIMRTTTRDIGAPGFDPIFAAGLLNTYSIGFQAALSLPDPSSHLYMQRGEQVDDHCGAASAALGDLNGDGISEFAVGSPRYDGTAGVDAGRVRVYSGAKGNLLATLNGATAGEQFGSTITALGDINGDAIPDYAIASPTAVGDTQIDAGTIRLYSGTTHTVLLSIDGTQANGKFGSTIVALGDTNGDLVNDYVVTSPFSMVGSTPGVGSLRIFSGLNSTPILVVDGDDIGLDLEFGASMMAVEDQDLDSIEDLIVGVPGATPGGVDSGRFVLISSVTGVRLAEINGTTPNDRFGAAVVTWVDQNVDGKRDYAISAPGFDGPGGIDSGLVVIYESNMLTPISGFVGENPGDELGTALASGADMDGDTVEDLIIGAPGYDGPTVDCGKIYTYSTASNTPRYELFGRAAGQRFGTSVSSTGDIDADGLGEMIVGAEGSGVTGFSVILPARNPELAPPYGDSVMAGTLGSADNGPYDSFLINNSAGGADRIIFANVNEELSYSMLQPQANPNPAHFGLYGYLGLPHQNLTLTIPYGIGAALWLPCSATPANPVGFLITNSTLLDPCPQLVASTPTPWHFTDTVGIPFPIVVTFYGIIEETPSSLKVTNAIILVIQ